MPLTVGGRRTTVGIAPGTSTSSANSALPVMRSRTSMRVAGAPMTVNSAGRLGVGETAGRRIRAASAASEAYVAVRPSGALTTLSAVVRVVAGTRKRRAAAVTS